MDLDSNVPVVNGTTDDETIDRDGRITYTRHVTDPQTARWGETTIL